MTSTSRSAPPAPGLTAPSGARHVELFAGAGGMAIGCRAAGFDGVAEFYELNRNCCRTLRHNIGAAAPTLAGTVYEGDVQDVTWDGKAPVRLLAGGAPCQPFSLAGRHRADRDERNMFPEVFRAIRALRPEAVLLENVRGLLRPDFKPYFDYVLAQVADPSVAPRRDELWQDHFVRIRQHQGAAGYAPEYQVTYACLNAADYGVPQLRHRVFIVATMAGRPAYAFPRATHAKGELVAAQRRITYWEALGVPPPASPGLYYPCAGAYNSAFDHVPSTPAAATLDADGALKPWVTVREALAGLPAPAAQEAGASMNHWLIPGARSYTGHCGSRLDWPSKTVKAGVHGVAGGENTFVDTDGVYRYYTIREAARIQTFPDQHVFVGARSRIIGQIGNAVPCRFAAAIARPLLALLSNAGYDDAVPATRAQRAPRPFAGAPAGGRLA